MLQRTDPHTWELKTTWEQSIWARGGGEERENKAWQREKERLESAAVLQLNLYFGTLFHRAFVYDCLPPLVCELLKDQDHALFLYPQPPAQVGEKKLRGEVRKNLRSIYYVWSTAQEGPCHPRGISMSY